MIRDPVRNAGVAVATFAPPTGRPASSNAGRAALEVGHHALRQRVARESGDEQTEGEDPGAHVVIERTAAGCRSIFHARPDTAKSFRFHPDRSRYGTTSIIARVTLSPISKASADFWPLCTVPIHV